ncbi:DUF6268 family outer membrane beta-barrel protein [Bacterioplanoides sp.]|uniref:DUF6268 family outer membrane beta-barrel protein n=1 Tax=Bacterioplanoides sp. TaxID=2066072 RepID=UPI003B00BC93
MLMMGNQAKNVVRRSVAMLALLASMPLMANTAGLLVTSEGPGSPESGAGDEFSSSQVSLTLPLEDRGSRQEKVRTFFHIDQTKFDLEGTTAAQGEYYWISLPLQYQQRRSRKNEFLVNAELGLMTDLNKIESDALALNLELLGRRYRNNGSFWQYGVVVDRSFGDYNPRPALAVSWEASRHTQVLLGFPRTRVDTRWSKSLSTFLHIRPAGGVWREEIEGQSKSASLNYRNWRFGIGGEFHWRGHLWLTGEVGQTRLRTIEGRDETNAKVTSRPGDDAYTQIGVRVRF